MNYIVTISEEDGETYEYPVEADSVEEAFTAALVDHFGDDFDTDIYVRDGDCINGAYVSIDWEE